MRIQVRLFATYREIVGSRGFTWSSRDGLSLRELVDGVVAKYPRLADHRDTMLLAVNHDLAASHRILRAGDEAALLPPLSGGARGSRFGGRGSIWRRWSRACGGGARV